MTTTLPFKFERIESGTQNITQFVTQVDSCKFQGSGKIRSLSLMLNVEGGAFISNANFLGANFTPIINQFDKFKITWTDPAALTRALIAEVDQELGQKVLSGFTLPIEFKGREAALQRKKFTAFYQFKTPRFVIEDIITRWNAPGNKGTDEPTVSFTGDSMNFIDTVPRTIVNIYDFTKEISYYDALMQVIRRLNQPVAQQGIGDFYSMVFTDGEDLIAPQADTIILRIFVQGVGTPTVLQSTPNNPFNSLTYQLHSESGNQILVRGQQGTGYQPKEFHEFISFVEQINNYPAHIVGESYITGIIVRATDNNLYNANKTTTTTPPGVDWDLTNPNTIIPAIDYSRWTKNRVTETRNGMANATATIGVGGFNSPAFWDGNMVIKEKHNFVTNAFVFFREWANTRKKDPGDISTAWTNFAGAGGLYNGFRCLVDKLTN